TMKAPCYGTYLRLSGTLVQVLSILLMTVNPPPKKRRPLLSSHPAAPGPASPSIHPTHLLQIDPPAEENGTGRTAVVDARGATSNKHVAPHPIPVTTTPSRAPPIPSGPGAAASIHTPCVTTRRLEKMGE